MNSGPVRFGPVRVLIKAQDKVRTVSSKALYRKTVWWSSYSCHFTLKPFQSVHCVRCPPHCDILLLHNATQIFPITDHHPNKLCHLPSILISTHQWNDLQITPRPPNSYNLVVRQMISGLISQLLVHHIKCTHNTIGDIMSCSKQQSYIQLAR